MNKWLFIIVLGTIFSSCVFENEEVLYGHTFCDTSNVSFATHIFPLIQSSCATSECHSPSGSGNGWFENYAQIKVKVDDGSFPYRVLELKDMPPTTPLTACELAKISRWLENGAPNN